MHRGEEEEEPARKGMLLSYPQYYAYKEDNTLDFPNEPGKQRGEFPRRVL